MATESVFMTMGFENFCDKAHQKVLLQFQAILLLTSLQISERNTTFMRFSLGVIAIATRQCHYTALL